MDIVADLLADGGDPRHVLGNLAMHFDLQIAVALVDQLLRCRRHFGRSLDCEDAQNRHAVAHLSAEQHMQRNAERACLEVVQRAVDRGLRLRRTAQRAVERHQYRLDIVWVLADD